MRFLVFIISWVGVSAFVDHFNISGPWAMLCGLIALFMSDFINYALRSKHERA